MRPSRIYANGQRPGLRSPQANPSGQSRRPAASNPMIAIPGVPGCIAISNRVWLVCLSERGAGASPPAFPLPTEQAQAQVCALLQQAPWQAGLSRSRWWLDGIRQAISWLSDGCLATVQHTLARWKLVYRRGRRAVHSPDSRVPQQGSPHRDHRLVQSAAAGPDRPAL